MTKPAGIIEIDPGEFLKRKMGSAKLSGVQLAKRIDCHVQTIYNVTRKKRPISPRLAVKLGRLWKEQPADFWLKNPIEIPVTHPWAGIAASGPFDVPSSQREENFREAAQIAVSIDLMHAVKAREELLLAFLGVGIEMGDPALRRMTDDWARQLVQALTQECG